MSRPTNQRKEKEKRQKTKYRVQKADRRKAGKKMQKKERTIEDSEKEQTRTTRKEGDSSILLPLMGPVRARAIHR